MKYVRGLIERTNMRRKSILLKLFRTIFITIIGIAIIMVIAFYTYYRKILENEIIQTNLSVMQQSSDDIEKVVFDSIELTENIAYNHGIIEALKEIKENGTLEVNEDFLAETIQIIMDDFMWSNTRQSQLCNAYVVDLKGLSYNSSFSDNERFEDIVDMFALDEFVKGDAKQVVFDTQYNFNSNGIYRYSFQILQKITDHITGDLYGYVLLNISENQLYSSYREMITGDKESYIVNKFGQVISARNKRDIFKQMPLHSDFSKSINYYTKSNKEPLNSWQNIIHKIKGGEIYILSTRVAGTEWYLVQTIPTKIALEPLRGVVLYSVCILLLFTLVVYLLIHRYTKIIAKPILFLKEKMNKVRSGAYDTIIDMSEELPFSEVNEFTEIAEAFNILMEYLNTTIADVKDKEKQKRLVEQDFLRAQINPHFIYNSLTSIRFFIGMNKSKEAEDMLLYFSKILRKTLSRTDEFVTLKEEMETIRDYVKLQSFRYPNYLEVEYKIEEGLEYQIVPSFILQPIVENAIFHGMKQAEKCHILIQGFHKDNNLVIEIVDNGRGMNQEQLSNIFEEHKDFQVNKVGLKNVNERIVLNFGLEYGMFITSQEGKGTTVTLLLPIRKDDENAEDSNR